MPYLPKSKPIQVPGIGWSLPEGLEAVNQEKYDFRVKASPSPRAGQQRPVIDFTDLMTEEERQLWKQNQRQ